MELRPEDLTCHQSMLRVTHAHKGHGIRIRKRDQPFCAMLWITNPVYSSSFFVAEPITVSVIIEDLRDLGLGVLSILYFGIQAGR